MAANRKGGPGTAAYVWTEEREIFIGEHSESSFHHSTFVSGRAVRCAGMIKVKGGMVTFLSNNSGHYKPGYANLKSFAEYLWSNRAVYSGTDVTCLGKTDWEGKIGVFLQSTSIGNA
jgi:hypothetical protein